MHLIPYYIYSGCDAEKEKKSSAPISRVLSSYRNKNVCHLSSPKVTLGLKHSTLHSSPKAIGRAALNLRYT